MVIVSKRSAAYSVNFAGTRCCPMWAAPDFTLPILGSSAFLEVGLEFAIPARTGFWGSKQAMYVCTMGKITKKHVFLIGLYYW